MRLTAVLLKRKGQLRTPKNYQNPLGIQGVLTHTKGVELVPKVPKFRSGPDIHKGAVRKVIQMKTPWDVRREMELSQVARENEKLLRNTPPYLNKEEEKVFFSLLSEKEANKSATGVKLSPLEHKLMKTELRTIEKTIWKLRRSDAPRPEDLNRKYKPGEIRTDTYNVEYGLQEFSNKFKKGDPDYPLV